MIGIALWAGCSEPAVHHPHSEPPAPDAIVDPVASVDPDVATLIRVDWDQIEASDEVWVSWTFEGAELESPRVPVAAGPGHAVVLGLPASVTVALAVHAVVDGVEQVDALGETSTGPLPEPLVDATLEVDEPGVRSEPYLLTSVGFGPFTWGGPFYTVILDLQGRVVWYRLTDRQRLTWEPQVSDVGPYLLIDENTLHGDDGSPPVVRRVSLDGTLDQPTDLVGMGLSYDEADDGSLVFAEHEPLYAHSWLTRQAPDGSRERLWDCDAWSLALGGNPGGDCEINAALWSATRQSVTLSMFNVGTLVEVPMDGGPIDQWGSLPGSWAIDPPDAAFKLQHGPRWTADGHLLLSAHSTDQQSQWLREFAIDDADEELVQVWSTKSTFFAPYAGGAVKVGNGDAVWELGITGRIEEVTLDGDVVWQAVWPGHLVGWVTPMSDLYAVR